MNEARKITPLRAIRARCLECSGGSTAEVRECVIPSCPLYPFRMGKNPNIVLSDEQRAARAERVRKLASHNAEESHESRSEGNYTQRASNATDTTQHGEKGETE